MEVRVDGGETSAATPHAAEARDHDPPSRSTGRLCKPPGPQRSARPTNRLARTPTCSRPRLGLDYLRPRCQHANRHVHGLCVEQRGGPPGNTPPRGSPLAESPASFAIRFTVRDLFLLMIIAGLALSGVLHLLQKIRH